MGKQVYGWDDVTDKEVEEILLALENCRREVMIKDCDSDDVVDIVCIDRRKFERNPFIPIPYEHKDPQRYLDALLTNIRIASDRLSNYLRDERFKKAFPQ